MIQRDSLTESFRVFFHVAIPLLSRCNVVPPFVCGIIDVWTKLKSWGDFQMSETIILGYRCLSKGIDSFSFVRRFKAGMVVEGFVLVCRQSVLLQRATALSTCIFATTDFHY